MKFTIKSISKNYYNRGIIFIFTVGISLLLVMEQFNFDSRKYLKIFVLFDPIYAIGIGMGTFFGNMISPFVSAWEIKIYAIN